MSKFYFDCYDGDVMLIDQHGIDLDGVHEVDEQAIELAAKLLTESLPFLRSRVIFVSVRDENGSVIYCANGGLAGDYTKHDAAQGRNVKIKP